MQITHNQKPVDIPAVLVQGAQTTLAGIALLVMSLIILGQSVFILSKIGQILSLLFGG